jgi:hypothetical protein
MLGLQAVKQNLVLRSSALCRKTDAYHFRMQNLARHEIAYKMTNSEQSW